MRAVVFVVATAILFGAAASAQTVLKPEQALTVAGKFKGKKTGPAEDISGMACAPAAADAVRTCLVVNDENDGPQLATLRGDRIEPGATVPLIAADADPATLGREPTLPCDRRGNFDNLDGEAVTYAAPFFYVAGSHGCARKSGEFRLGSFHLGRLQLDAQGRAGKAELTYRLIDVLARADKVSAFVGKPLNEENGLNIEGIAIVAGRLVVGLRAPVVDGQAYLVATDAAALFAPGHEPASGTPETIPLALGRDRGIRDLAALEDGRVLVLAGPSQEQEVPYGLFVAELRANGSLQHLGDLEPIREQGKMGKAEGITVLAQAADMLTVIVLFDDLKDGRPQLYRVRR